MTPQEVIEEIKHFPISEKVKIIEQISQNLLADLNNEEDQENQSDGEEEKLSIEERLAMVESLYGCAAVEGQLPMTDEEIREDYTNYLMEKYS